MQARCNLSWNMPRSCKSEQQSAFLFWIFVAIVAVVIAADHLLVYFVICVKEPEKHVHISEYLRT